MQLHITDRTTAPAYVLVSENWDAPWRARIDGRDAPVLRGDVTLLTVPVPAGAREVELWYESTAYTRGRALSLLALLTACAAIFAPVIVRRARASDLRPVVQA
jgi:uncharacterized membrane protein YfhO